MISSDLDAKKIEDIAVATLRDIADYMRKWLPLVSAAIRSEDEKELAAAKAKVAAIEARIGLSKPILLGAAAIPTDVAIATTAMKGKSAEWAETDAGMGVGASASTLMASSSLEAFQGELVALRQHNQEKRRRRGLA
jgi:hypothetical protein